jgi:hypothetical protein
MRKGFESSANDNAPENGFAGALFDAGTRAPVTPDQPIAGDPGNVLGEPKVPE